MKGTRMRWSYIILPFQSRPRCPSISPWSDRKMMTVSSSTPRDSSASRHAADFAIDQTYTAVVVGDHLAELFLGKRSEVALTGTRSKLRYSRMLDIREVRRHVHRFRRIHRIEGFGRIERHVRVAERDPIEKRLAVVSRDDSLGVASYVGVDIVIVAERERSRSVVFRIAPLLGVFEVCVVETLFAESGPVLVVLGKHLALDEEAVVEPVELVDRREVHLAYRVGVIAGVAERGGEGRFAFGQVVPVPLDAVGAGVAPGEHRRAAWLADRALHEEVLAARALARETVDVGCSYDRVANATESIPAKLVHRDDDDIRPGGHGLEF